jgi:N-acetyl-gamma-glutamyl-phosphate reductase
MFKAIICGATGYTGVELIRILSSHPEVKVVGGSSRQWAQSNISELFPFVPKSNDFKLKRLDDLLAEPEADVAFLALPHGGSAQAVRPLLQAGVKVIDLSADCRLRDPAVYNQWYGEHNDPGILESAVYGLPEINRERIRDAALIANPGCYPTSVILGLAPLMGGELAHINRPIIDSKSAISGAGRGPKLVTSFCESGEGFKPYGVLGHRHIPEMEQELTALAQQDVKVRFTPHLIPAIRGMISDIYLESRDGVTGERVRELYRERYKDETFIRILDAGSYPDTAMTRGANLCIVSVEKDERTGLLIIISAIDNLVKGASGQAVQNMNIALGLKESSGLEHQPLFP